MSRPEESILAGAWEEPGNPEIVHEKILQAAQAAFSADVCTIFPLNPITGDFTSDPQIYGKLLDPSRSWVTRPSLGGLTRKVLAKKQVLIDDLAAAPEWRSTFTDTEGVAAFAGLALRSRARLKPFAVLYLDYRQAQAFDIVYRRRLSQFSAQASSVLQSTWLLHRYRKVIELGQEINQGLDTYENLFNKLEQHTCNLLDTSCFFLLGVYSAQTETMDLFYRSRGESKVRKLQPLPAECRKLLDDRQPVIIRSVSQQAAPPLLIDELRGTELLKIESLVLVPLLLRDMPLGVLSVLHTKIEAYDQEDLHTLQLMANHVASALNNIHLFADLDQISETGQLLTGQLSADQVLQSVVDRIRDATGADLVNLYPYHPETREFALPPRISGDLVQPDFLQPTVCQEGDIPYLTMTLDGPQLLGDAGDLPRLLGIAPDRLGHFQEREGVVSLVVVPLRVGGEAVGVLFANFRNRQIFSGSQKRLIKGLAIFVAIAIKNAWKFGRHGQELEALRRIDAKLKSSLGLDTVLNTVLEEANQILQAEHASIMLMDSSKKMLQFAAFLGSPPLEKGGGITRWVFDNRQTVHAYDIADDAEWKSLYVDAFGGTRSELDTPLFDEQNETIGVLNFESPRRAAFGDEDKRFVEVLAGQVALAVKNAQMYELAKRRAKDRENLIEISRQIVSQLELDKLLDIILAKAIEMTQAAAGVLLQYDAKRDDLVFRAEQGMEAEHRGSRITLDKGVVGYVAGKREMLNIDPGEPQWSTRYLPYAKGIRSALAVPLLAGERLWGVLEVESPEPNHFQARAELLVKALADMAIVALQNAERYQEAQEGHRRQRALQDLSQRIIRQSARLDDVMRSVLQSAIELTGASRSVLDIYEGDAPVKAYNCYARAGDLPAIESFDLTIDEAPELPRGIMKQVAATRAPYHTKSDAQEDPLYRGDSVVHSEICVPLLDEHDNLIGVLDVLSGEPFAFDETAQELLSLFADQAVIAIQNARSHEGARRELDRFEALWDAGNKLAELSEGQQRRDACQSVAQVVSDRRQCRAIVRVYDAEQEEFVLIAASGSEANEKPFDRMKVTEGVSGRVFSTGKTQLINDILKIPPEMPPPMLTDPLKRSLLVAPIKLGQGFYGTLSLSHRQPNFFHAADKKLAEGLAKLLAITFHRLEIIQHRRDLLERNKQIELIGWIGDASYNLAHRLISDLGLIRSHVNDAEDALKLRSFSDPEVDESLTTIAAKTQKVLDLSEKLRGVVAGFRIDEATVVDIQAILEEVKEAFRGLPSSQLLVIELAEDVGSVRVVQAHIVDILRNLVTNGFEAMSKGGMVTIRVRNHERSVCIEVEDTGPGVPSEHVGNIFKFLYSTKGGSGFGLWSSLKKAQVNGGTLRFHNLPSKGAVFTLMLPHAEPRLEVEYGR